MEFWSTGLGKRSMGIDIGAEDIKIADSDVQLAGTVRPPLSWHYTINMDKDDWVEFLETAFHPVIVGYLVQPAKWRTTFKASIYLSVFFMKYIVSLIAGVFWKRR